MNKFSRKIWTSVIASVVLSLPGSLMAGPIIVTINDVPNGRPVIKVQGAPHGYDIYTGGGVSNPAIEDGALITLFGVNNSIENPTAALPDWGGRFLDARPWESLPPWEPYGDGVNYRQYRNALDIVWIEHNFYTPGLHEGDLVVGFNSAFPGTWYFNPVMTGDENLGPVTDNWVTIYSNEILVIRFKPHTNGLKK